MSRVHPGIFRAVVGAVMTKSFARFVGVSRLVAGLGLLWTAAVGRAHGTASEVPRWITLEAIHRLENPRNLTRPGPRGELGAYQFRQATWRMHTAVPFAQALDRRTSDVVAIRHYDWLKRGLESARLPPSPYYIALAWNGGLAAAIAGRSPLRAHEYAGRAVNIAASLNGGAMVAATGR